MLQVYHLQKLKEKPLKPWIIAEHDGKVISTHRDCLAGLGEVCTHVALLFWVEVRVNMRNSQTVTGEKAYWMVSTSAPGDNAMLPFRDIDFISALDRLCHQQCSGMPIIFISDVQKLTKDELHELFSTLSTCSHKGAILAVLPDFSHQLKPRSLRKDFPGVLTNLFQPCRMHMTLDELIIACEKSTNEVSQEHVDCVEQETCSQSKNPLWFKFCAG